MRLPPLNIPSLREASDMADVTFCFNDIGQKGTKELKANKTILACASEVFMAQFFRSTHVEKVILVEDSNVDAFDTFLDILYHIGVDLKGKNSKFLGELFYLAEKYHVNELKTLIIEAVESKNIDIKDILDIMTIAEATSELKNFSESLVQLCVKLVLASSAEALAEYFNMCEVEESTSYLLHKLMSKVNNKLKSEVNTEKCCKKFRLSLALTDN